MKENLSQASIEPLEVEHPRLRINLSRTHIKFKNIG